jgi:hypothetical protein
MSKKVILIDSSGWEDLILGVVIVALSRTRRSHLKLSNQKYMIRRIPTSSFQPPNFKNKRYLDDAVKIAEEIIEVMRPDEETLFKISSGYVLSSIRRYLWDRGYSVEEVKITGELQEIVEKTYLEWCVEVGVPPERLKGERRFWTLLEWIAEKPKIREGLVKTGWKSWEKKWREKAFEKVISKELKKRSRILQNDARV